MAQEDNIRDDLGAVLLRVSHLPRPKVREKILWDTMEWCAAVLGFELQKRIEK